MANPDLQALVDSLLSFAQSMVSEHGSFNPFGAMMFTDGQIQWVGADNGEEFPAAQDLIDIMNGMLQAKSASGEIRAGTICYDALTIPPGETAKVGAISFNLEHLSGESIGVFVPYFRAENGAVRYGELFAVKRPPQFFLHSAAAR